MVNVPMSSELKRSIDQVVASGWYSSISELMREGARRVIKSSSKITVNGFTEEFENHVLEAEKGSRDDDLVIETEEQLEKYLNELRQGRP